MLAGVTFSFYDENKTYLFYIGRILSGIGNSKYKPSVLSCFEMIRSTDYCRAKEKGSISKNAFFWKNAVEIYSPHGLLQMDHFFRINMSKGTLYDVF